MKKRIYLMVVLAIVLRKEDFCSNMNIAVDSGNTYSKIGWFSEDELIKYETMLDFQQLLMTIRLGKPEHIMYSSVNRPADEFMAALELEVPIFNLSSETPVPIIKDYDTPTTLGADRVAAAVGANWLFPDRDLVVIDMGTCVTYDLIGREGTFEGGLISPGMRMRFNAMHTFTKRLPLISPSENAVFIGKSTEQAMRSGVMNGMLAEIEGIIERYRHEKPTLCVVTCGGDAPFFESNLKHPIFAVPELVLIGLNRILRYNVALQ